MAAGTKQKMEVSLEQLKTFSKDISDLDAKLASASGQGAAAKKAIRERIAAEVATDATKLIGRISKALEETDDKTLVGVLVKLDELVAPLKERAEKVVTAEQESAKTESGESTDKMREDRKKLVLTFNALKTLLEEQLGIDTAEVPLPKRAGGGGKGGKRGPRGKTSGFNFSIDGKQMGDSQNSFSATAFYATKGVKEAEGQQSAYLKSLVVAKYGEEFAKLDEWEVNVPVGDGKTKVVKAVRKPVEATPETTTEPTPEPANA